MNILQRLSSIRVSALDVACVVGAGIGISRAIAYYHRSSMKSRAIRSPGERKKSEVYTRTGDKGSASLYNGERLQKSDPIFKALGETDELNACIGLAREHCAAADNGLQDMLAEIQSRLFDVGAAIATPVKRSSEDKIAYTEFSSRFTEQLEEWIDSLDANLAPLTNFIIPSGGLSGTHLNLSRAVCRRAERAVVDLIADGQMSNEVGKYLNRLSDFLFVASRHAAKVEGRQELIWRKPHVWTRANSHLVEQLIPIWLNS